MCVRAWCVAAVAIALCVAHACAARAGPQVAVSYFASLPAKVSYFDDSSDILWHDAEAGDVYRSADEGKKWQRVDGPPPSAAALLVEHPHDSRQAYILSTGREHWRTTNRGASWQRFRTPDSPSLRAGSPLEFHADEKHYDYILYMGSKCSMWTPLRGKVCHDVAYYTADAFATPIQPLMDTVLHCTWAKRTRDVAVSLPAMQRIFCIAWETGGTAGARRVAPERTANRLFQSDDFFATHQVADMAGSSEARGFLGLGASRQFLIAALQPAPGQGMSLFVSRDATTWVRARFPHGQELHEHAYTVLAGPAFHLLVDVLDAATGTGTLFLSDSSGTHFTRGLEGTLRNARGIVDYEHLANIDGAAIANTRTAATPPRVQTHITHDDGSSWTHLAPPARDIDGRAFPCSGAPLERCALHLHALVHAHNTGLAFSSSAPGLVMGVGSVGDTLRAYGDSDTFLSTDAGASWRMVARGPHKYEFGDQGALLVRVADERATDYVTYSFDYGATWERLALGVSVVPYLLTTVPDGTALKFLLVGSQAGGPGGRAARDERRERDAWREGSVRDAGYGRAASRPQHLALFLDFATVPKRRCGPQDYEKWYATRRDGACLMGRRQWYRRRKADADCIVGEKFQDPVGQADACACTADDYECDFGFARDATGACVAEEREAVPPGACAHAGDTYLGSSGYRRIAGNTCVAQGTALDAKQEKPCAQAAPVHGAQEIVRRRYEFPAPVADVLHFQASPRVVVRLTDGAVFQSADDGSTWRPLRLHVPQFAESRALALLAHPHDRQRAYIVTQGQMVYYTLDAGLSWMWFSAPLDANALGLAPLGFHAHEHDWLLWTGSRECVGGAPASACHTEAFYSLNNGQRWHRVDTYVRKCVFLAHPHFRADRGTILCESYAEKRGSQLALGAGGALQLVYGADLYRDRRVLFPNVLGFSVTEEFLLVAEMDAAPGRPAAFGRLAMHVSMDARTFAPIQLPPGMPADHHAYTVLDSVTRSVFLHVTAQAPARAEWGDLVTSNSNGTYYTRSLADVNRDAHGYVDFEKMLGLDGVALANIVGNVADASVSRRKRLQTRITHNDGGRWKPLTPPTRDSRGNAYACADVGCNLHLHGLLERPDVRLMTSSPSATGFMLGVGNVGRELAPYGEGDTFLTRDGGFSWEEVHKDAHQWDFGDHGSVIVLADSVRPTASVLYTLDQGLSWHAFPLGDTMRVWTIDTVPEDTQRTFILFGETTSVPPRHVALHLDFSQLLSRQCVFDPDDALRSDFEKWSPSQHRVETCLFGRQTWYWRRKRDRICFVGDAMPQQHVERRQCPCSAEDFECEFNHYRDPETGECVLYPGTAPLPADSAAQCARDAPEYDGYWYDRTNHRCARRSRVRGALRVLLAVAALVAVAAGAVVWCAQRGTPRYGRIALSHVQQAPMYQDAREHAGLLVHFLGGLVGRAVARAREHAERVPLFARAHAFARPRDHASTYHMLSTDEDAEILRGYDSDDLGSAAQ
ncbi:vacuolar protein sorting/targeting protein PEP1 [Malassezia sp. CBS 17886]|nr:vacuolar protein sorting/targeting protein PEP1 [Malassezia sp. CBS 17886]